MSPPEITESTYLGVEENKSSRRHSQSHAVSNSSTNDSLTKPYTRGRSFSTSVVQGSALAAQVIATVNNNLNMDDESSLLSKASHFVDETCEITKALVLGSKRLLLLEELPKDRRENQYVLSGYRFYRSTRQCLKSLFKLHNETMNIWSHLLGFFFFLYLTLQVFQSKFPDASIQDLTVFTSFSVASLTCLLCSSIYHTFICHSAKHVKSFTATLDYIGITLLITASISKVVYFGFYCEPISRNRYIIFSCLIGSIGIILPFFKFFDTKRYRPLRIGLFVAMAVSSIIPLLHLASVKGVMDTIRFLKPALLGGAMYTCGVIIYGKRFPEKFYPGKFDFAGMTSHAIWHIFVCLGIFFHFTGSFHFYDLREAYGCMLQ